MFSVQELYGQFTLRLYSFEVAYLSAVYQRTQSAASRCFSRFVIAAVYEEAYGWKKPAACLSKTLYLMHTLRPPLSFSRGNGGCIIIAF